MRRPKWPRRHGPELSFLAPSGPPGRSHASFDRILGIIVPRRGGVTRYYKPIHESLVFLGKFIVKRSAILMPLFLGPGADNRCRDDPVIQHPGKCELPRCDSKRF